jgi:hypothetical protein
VFSWIAQSGLYHKLETLEGKKLLAASHQFLKWLLKVVFESVQHVAAWVIW